MDIRHSRTLRLAGSVSAESEETLLGRLERSRVVVAVGSKEDAVRTTEVLVDTLRRLPIKLVLEQGSLGAEEVGQITRIAERIDPVRGIEVGRAARDDVLISVAQDRPEATVAGMPIRHGALVVSGQPLEPLGGGSSGLGVFTCAALLAGEVFKRVAAVRTQRATFPGRLAWCPVALDDDPWSTPLLNGPPQLDLALVGQGAIGTATTRILGLLGAEGRVQVIDPERFGPENLGTYSLGTIEDAELKPWKVDLGAAELADMDVETHACTAVEFIEKVDRREVRWPQLVLTGLDSATARREVQRLWPDHLIDGATGDTMCGLHDVVFEQTACLMCLFPEQRGGPGAAERLAEATGLPVEVVSHGDRPLEESDIAPLDPERRRELRPLVGKPICGIAEAIGLTELAAGDYRPSVPFVSQQAACMVVGRLIAGLVGSGAPATNFAQYDALIGPQAATLEYRRPSAGCHCQVRAGLLEAVRRARRG
jgi:ThiF family